MRAKRAAALPSEKWDILNHFVLVTYLIEEKCFTNDEDDDLSWHQKKQMELHWGKMHLCCKNLDLHQNDEMIKAKNGL